MLSVTVPSESSPVTALTVPSAPLSSQVGATETPSAYVIPLTAPVCGEYDTVAARVPLTDMLCSIPSAAW